MKKDFGFWAGLPATLSLVMAAGAFVPAAHASSESEAEQSSQSTWEQTSEQSSQQSAQQQSSGGSEALQQIAEQESDLSEFVKAVEKAGMQDALTSGTSYTIFAPTNDAIESDSELSQLIESDDPQDREKLVEVLRAHIVADDVDQEMAQRIGQARTIGGGTLDLTSEEDKLKVQDAEVVTADIQQGSLRIHAIDSVLDAQGGQMASMSGSQSGETSSTSSTSGSQSGQSGQMASSTGTPDFDEIDQDGDGYLSEEELQRHEELAQQQDQIDANQDGRVSRTEFSAFEQEQQGGASDPYASDPQSSTGRSGSDMPPHHEGEEERQSGDW